MYTKITIRSYNLDVTKIGTIFEFLEFKCLNSCKDWFVSEILSKRDLSIEIDLSMNLNIDLNTQTFKWP